MEKMELSINKSTDLQETHRANGYNTMLGMFEQTVREECQGIYQVKARTLFDMGFYDHAVLEYWNRSSTDLKEKLTIYGLEHFPSELNLKIKTREDLTNLKDSQIIEACYLLGIIDSEANVFLKHCLNIRNNFSAAHDTDSPIDPMEALNLIKNCVKYVLQRDVPSPAMTINELLNYIQSATFDINHFEDIIKDQSAKIVESFLKRIFNEYINPQTTKDYRDNLKKMVKNVWLRVGDDIKSDIGQKLLQLKLEDEIDKSLYAMDFMQKVNGIKFIPLSVRKHIFIKKAKELIDAHHGMNNFYTEVIHSQELEELGFNVPDESMDIYVRSIIFSYTGNSWGFSNGAEAHTLSMIENLSTKGVEKLLEALQNDSSYAWHFSSNAPSKRLEFVFETLKEKSNLLPKHKTVIEKYLKMKSLKEHFMNMT